MNIPLKPIMTPCIGVCQIAPDQLCDGCFRTMDEIAQWSHLSDAQRQHFMDVVMVEREQQRASCASMKAN